MSVLIIVIRTGAVTEIPLRVCSFPLRFMMILALGHTGWRCPLVCLFFFAFYFSGCLCLGARRGGGGGGG
eukprot:COSAG01_NODE_4364_length_5094_cov_26.560561_8_plen_69_part_01